MSEGEMSDDFKGAEVTIKGDGATLMEKAMGILTVVMGALGSYGETPTQGAPSAYPAQVRAR